MGLNIITRTFILLIPLVLVVAEDNGHRKLSKITWHQVQSTMNKLQKQALEEISRIPTEIPDMDRMDPSLHIFFNMNDLRVGKCIPIYFLKKDPSTSPHFLPRKDADSFPFSSTQLQHLLELFSFSKNSPQAKAIEYTVKQCESQPIKGEIKFCATSLESMLDMTRKVFGHNSKVKVLTTTRLTKSSTKLQNYTILNDPREILADKVLGCHQLPYPYAVFYCHCQEGGNRLFEVSLAGEDGQRVEAVAMCHMDTSLWDSDHVAFRLLGIQPGKAPVCHFFPADNLVWVPVAD